ncbi:flavin reductase [Rhodovastum atsumiense]|nr:flavin reductase [Rhodovastum atsumiense]CAH2600206.1 flavin reductase [Rhodovastum atsumiense]
MAVDRQLYREAMARVGAAVHVITTDGPAGRHGFTASAVCSVTDDPPTLLVCQKRTSDSNAAFKRNGVLCVNTLADAHQDLSSVFAGLTECDMAGRFAAGAWGEAVTGAPVLQGALVVFDCRIAQVVEVGTHSVLFCEVAAIVPGEGKAGLIYFGRRYHPVGAATPD